MKSASIGEFKESLIEALKNFKCCKDNDVQNFLNSSAIDFEKRGLATTYLLLAKDKFENGVLFIEGYFSLTHKAVIYQESVSLTSRKKLSGNKKTETESFALIAQLAKRMEINEEGNLISSELTSSELLNDAIQIIEESSEYIICRNVMIECKPIEKVKSIYEKFGFTDLQKSKNGELHTLYLKLESKIDF